MNKINTMKKEPDKLTTEFLESKVIYYDHPQFGTIPERSGYGNITPIGNSILRFTEYNLLPGIDGQLDGHYMIYVNISTFQYLLYKYAGYGNLISVSESDNTNWVKNLISREKARIESLIAYKLLGAYFYNGPMLIEGDGKFSYKSSGIFPPHSWDVEYKDKEALESISTLITQ